MLRYFATNRGAEHLARNLSRDQRLKLETGGYFFLDMKKYMSFYFATTDEETMPPTALVLNSDGDVFGNDFLGHPSVGTVVICIHGFNVELREAATWFRILTNTMRHSPSMRGNFVTDPDDLEDRARMEGADPGSLHAFIGFSWPSAGNALNYLRDQGRAIETAPALANLVLRCILAGKRVKLVCHSMGNYLTCHMLEGLVKKTIVPHAVSRLPDGKRESVLKRLERATVRVSEGENSPRPDRAAEDFLIDTYVMIAPDVERRHVTKVWEDSRAADRVGANAEPARGSLDATYVGPFYSGLEHLCGQVVNVYSRFDGALSISNIAQSGKDKALMVGGAVSTLTFGLLDFLERNPDQRWEMRLGSAPHPFNAPWNMISLNATEIADRKIDHSDHIDCPPLVKAIGAALGLKA